MSEKQVHLGTIPPKNGYRDATHVAVIGCKLASSMLRGALVVVEKIDGVWTARAPKDKEKTTGIIDPFFWGKPKSGSEVWVILHPNSVIGLRHVYVHPELDKNSSYEEEELSKVELAKAILGKWCDDHNIEMDDLLAHARDYVDYNEYWSEGARFEGMWFEDKLWEHIETIWGKKVPESDRGSFFSCSC